MLSAAHLQEELKSKINNMENIVLTELINNLLPSVEGEDEKLITAEKLRTVLLQVYDKSVTDSLTASKGALNYSYDELARNKIAETLIPGQYYSFIYQTKHVLPHTENVINVGVEETLIIQANSFNSFYKQVKSVQFIKDEIDYDFDLNLCEDGITSRFGWITRRKDTQFNNEIIGFDFRNVKFRRFKTDVSTLLEWESDVIYSPGQVVLSNSSIYVCFKETEAGEVPSNPAYFFQLWNVDEFVNRSSNGEDILIQLNDDFYAAFKGNILNFTDYLFLQNSEGVINGANIYNNTFDFTNKQLIDCNNVIIGNCYNNTLIGTFTENTFKGNYHDNHVNSVAGIVNNVILNNLSIFANEVSGDSSSIGWNILINGTIDSNMLTMSGSIVGNILFYGNISLNLLNTGSIGSNILASGQIAYNCLYNTSSIAANIISEGNILSNMLYDGSQICMTLFSRNFCNNSLINVSNIDFSLSSHVYFQYFCEIANTPEWVSYLRYVNADNVQCIVSPTE